MLPPLTSPRAGMTVCQVVQTFRLDFRISLQAQAEAAAEPTEPSLPMIHRQRAMHFPTSSMPTPWGEQPRRTLLALATRAGETEPVVPVLEVDWGPEAAFLWAGEVELAGPEELGAARAAMRV